MDDLQFGEFERFALKKNQVRKTIVTYHFDDRIQVDTIVYDTTGRKVRQTDPSGNLTLSYNSFGLVIAKQFGDNEHFTIDSASYIYQPDSLTLYQSWLYDSYIYKHRFDHRGRLTEILRLKSQNSSPVFISKYKYDGNRLSKIDMLRRGQNGVIFPVGGTTLYYSSNKIDSIVHVVEGQYKSKTVYDDHGLAEVSYSGNRLHATYMHSKTIN